MLYLAFPKSKMQKFSFFKSSKRQLSGLLRASISSETSVKQDAELMSEESLSLIISLCLSSKSGSILALDSLSSLFVLACSHMCPGGECFLFSKRKRVALNLDRILSHSAHALKCLHNLFCSRKDSSVTIYMCSPHLRLMLPDLQIKFVVDLFLPGGFVGQCFVCSVFRNRENSFQQLINPNAQALISQEMI